MIEKIKLFLKVWRMRLLFLKFNKLYAKSGNSNPAGCAIDTMNTYLREFSFQNVRRIENLRKEREKSESINPKSD